ncbi:MAG: DUF4040 domain-containing protein [Candidatus Omnitrophica bacterium]|nr:DUF4040 domain-containing protein [Candidatus Omnitrophota bacterium]
MVEMLGLLLIFMIIGAVIAIETKNLLSSVISVGAVGFGLSIAFLMLRAPDIAITQVVVEVLCLVILIRATISRDVTGISCDREFFAVVCAAVFLIAIFLFGIKALLALPEFGTPVMLLIKSAPTNTYISEGLKQTGAANIVSAILLDYRAYDTLGEATVLFTAILGGLAILRRKAKKEVTQIVEDKE